MFIPSFIHSSIHSLSASCLVPFVGQDWGLWEPGVGSYLNPFPACAVGPWTGWGTHLEVCSS